MNEIGTEYDNWIKESRSKRDEGEEEEDGESVGSAIEGGSTSPPPGGKPTKTSRKKRKQEILPPLDQVPLIFFDPSFNLSNPRTFDLVTERIQLTPSSSPSLTFSPVLSSPLNTTDPFLDTTLPGLGPSTLNELAKDQVLQDKLSHFTAVIESHLVQEIGLRSSSFFSALSNLQTLHQKGDETLVKIEELERLLKDRGSGVNGIARHGLEVLRLQARRRGLERIEESVRAVEEVGSALEGVKELVENGEWQDALEVSEQIEEAYYGSNRESTSNSIGGGKGGAGTTKLNLMKLKSLESLPIKLTLIRAQIAKSLEGELISVLEHEMDLFIEEDKGTKRARTSSSSSEGGEQMMENGNFGEGQEKEKDKERMKERTRPVVKALVRSEGMDSAVQAWRESVLREVRAMVREVSFERGFSALLSLVKLKEADH